MSTERNLVRNGRRRPGEGVYLTEIVRWRVCSENSMREAPPLQRNSNEYNDLHALYAGPIDIWYKRDE